jgi:hypothetical protein
MNDISHSLASLHDQPLTVIEQHPTGPMFDPLLPAVYIAIQNKGHFFGSGLFLFLLFIQLIFSSAGKREDKSKACSQGQC